MSKMNNNHEIGQDIALSSATYQTGCELFYSYCVSTNHILLKTLIADYFAEQVLAIQTHQ